LQNKPTQLQTQIYHVQTRVYIYIRQQIIMLSNDVHP